MKQDTLGKIERERRKFIIRKSKNSCGRNTRERWRKIKRMSSFSGARMSAGGPASRTDALVCPGTATGALLSHTHAAKHASWRCMNVGRQGRTSQERNSKVTTPICTRNTEWALSGTLLFEGHGEIGPMPASHKYTKTRHQVSSSINTTFTHLDSGS